MQNESTVIFLILALSCYLKDKLPVIGNLPGDILLDTANFRIFIPITSSILLTLLFSFIKGKIHF